MCSETQDRDFAPILQPTIAIFKKGTDDNRFQECPLINLDLPHLILCGASTRSLAESALRAGINPICVDFFGDQDLVELLSDAYRSSQATRPLSYYLRRISCFSEVPEKITDLDPSIPLMWTGGLENHLDLLRQLLTQRSLLGAPLPAVQVVRDLFTWQSWLADAGFHVPVTRSSDPFYVEKNENSPRGPVAESFASEKLTPPPVPSPTTWLAKPLGGAGGSGIVRVNSNPKEANSVSYPQLPNSHPQHQPDCSIIYQQLISGRPASATFVANHQGCSLIGCSLQLCGWKSLGAGEFQFCGNYGPITLPTALNASIEAAGQLTAAQAGLRGVFGIDFILPAGPRSGPGTRNSDPYFLEVNPRLTASHELFDLNLSPGTSLFLQHIRSCLCPEQSHPLNHGLTQHCDFSRVQSAAENQGPQQVRGLHRLSSHLPVSSADEFPGPVSDPKIRLLRMIVYAARDIRGKEFFDPESDAGKTVRLLDSRLTEPGHPAGVSDVPGCWLADYPPSGTEIPAGSPVCSVYISGKTLPEILKHVRSELVSKWLLRASGLCPERLEDELIASLFDTLES